MTKVRVRRAVWVLLTPRPPFSHVSIIADACSYLANGHVAVAREAAPDAQRSLVIAFMVTLDPAQHPHRRWNPLLEEFVLCSPHRTQRPWQGAQEATSTNQLPQYDETCYLCPGNVRATGAQNDAYTSTFVFENDYAALKPQAVDHQEQDASSISARLFRTEPARGRCYVLCFNPRHDLTLAHLTTPPYSSQEHIVPVVKAWQALYRDIPRENPFIRYIQFFENKGSAMGCSNPHPHGQVWSLDYIPNEPAKEMQSMHAFALDPRNASACGPRDDQGRPALLLEYAYLELNTPGQPRVVTCNRDFVALVPYWAVWPFEVLVVPYKRFLSSVADLLPDEIVSFAAILGEVACRFDNLFRTSFPYSMGIHQRPIPSDAPSSQDEHSDTALLHVHYYPPLLRSATVRKFLVGYVHFSHSFEMMSEPQRDITAESAAARLRDCATTHYSA